MKKILLLFPLVLLLAAMGCKKIDKLLTFNIEDSQNIKVSGGFPLGQIVPLTPLSVPTKSEEKFSNEGTSANLVKKVTLNQLTLTITNPNNENFDFLELIKIYISTDGNDKILLASLDPVPTGVKTITLNPTNAVLDKYIKAKSYTLTTEAKIRKPISSDITLRCDTRFQVTADPL
ncbi:hypothetical protein MTX78_00670 [Hymenobacter tibetensis]|uniref:DUF1735 domain-containing protein n=1 Tax=Hymenobacter tibetensis TaxID=497967 RepID=A0ABY4CXX1_9BACT|nr:hypothetical protein [Hymenobacter tibetensis]UOG75125.1 hypothetical protein MTX78_00670 [Hymenobacter tibetensis]